MSFDCYCRFDCYWGASTAKDARYFDRNMQIHGDWGSGTEGKCLCGIIGLCRNKTAACNCNGERTRYFHQDYGYITNNDILPIRGFRGKSSQGWARHLVGDLRCSGVQIDIPPNCDSQQSSTNVHLIDPDQRGKLQPFPALCFKPTCHNSVLTAQTIISHDNFGQKCSYNLEKNVSKGRNFLSYCAPVGQIQFLKQRLGFCIQEIRYDCLNSPILTRGNEHSHFFTINGEVIKNFGLGSSKNHTCPCAAINKCQHQRSCNCDSRENSWTYDFGWITNKDDLPVMGIKTENIGNGSAGKVTVGYLACSKSQFGIMGNCQMYRTRFREDDDNTFLFKNYLDSYVYPIDPDLKQSGINPFPVYCEMRDSETGVTVIPNLKRNSDCSNTSALCEIETKYFHSADQVAAIVGRSTYCHQSLSYKCRKAPLLLANESKTHAYWVSFQTGNKNFGFAKSFQTDADGGIGCGCYQKNVAECTANGRHLKCVCDIDDGISRTENIELDDKHQLPIKSMFVAGEEAFVEVHDMHCYDISRSCSKRYSIAWKLDAEETCIYQRLGNVYILPNQQKGGFDPIRARCNLGGETELQIRKHTI